MAEDIVANSIVGGTLLIVIGMALYGTMKVTRKHMGRYVYYRK